MQATLSATTDVLERADVLTEDQLDTLPVGMIQLDRAGTVLKFNQTESSLARVAKAEAIGRSFFDEVAPCTKVQEFYGRFAEGGRTARSTPCFRTSSAFATAGRRTW